MDLKNSEDLMNSNIDSNTKNIVKRVSTMCTIESFSTCVSVFKPCGKYDNSFGYTCNVNRLCEKCRVQKGTIENGHTFNFELDSKVKGSLGIHPYGRGGDSKDYVSLSLHFKEFSCLMITALCKFSISNVDGKEEYKSIIGVEEFDENKNSFCLQKFINRSDLLKRKSKLLPGDRLTVCFEIFYLCDDINTYGLSKATPIKEPLNIFLNDMSRMVDSSEYYDCIIKVGNHELNVHKCILDARSEVFRSALKRKRVEPESNIVEMNDFRLGVVKDMVNYLYTGKSPRIDEIATEMLEIAEKYKLEGLKMIATESLLRSLNVENVCEYLEKSELYSAEVLKEFCVRYIYLNAEEVVKYEKWRKIVNFYPLLLEKIFNVTAGID
uniref:BTB domain-containing protein n=1 Tax=Strongyloides papillosus TaxID=174720 RepID=A0A0N5B4K8_STREA